MKLKSFFAMAMLFVAALFSTAFVLRPTEQTSTANAAQKETFLEFLSQFKKVELPYSIGLDDMEDYQPYRSTTKAKSAAKTTRSAALRETRFIPLSEFGRFSRMGPPEMLPIARFYPNDRMVAVVYSADQIGRGLNMQYHLVLYDLKGNILSKSEGKKRISNQFELAYSSVEKSMTCSIDAKGNITQKTYKNRWKKDVSKQGYTDNALVGFDLEATTNFELDKSGNFNEARHLATASRATP